MSKFFYRSFGFAIIQKYQSFVEADVYLESSQTYVKEHPCKSS